MSRLLLLGVLTAVDAYVDQKDVSRWNEVIVDKNVQWVHDHLNTWEVPEDDRRDFDAIVSFLADQGLTGKRLIYLREHEFVKAPLLSEIKKTIDVPAPIIWDFFTLLENAPKNIAEISTDLPAGKDPRQIFVIGTGIFLSIGFVVFVFRKYPRSKDWKEPGNQTKRNGSLVAALIIIAIPVGAVAAYVIKGKTSESLRGVFNIVCCFFVVLNLMAVTDLSETLSTDIMEHADPEKIQESLKNNWTNTAILAALMFSIVAGYGFPMDSSMNLREFSGGQRLEARLGYAWNENVQYIFFASSCFAFAEYLISMLLASMHLFWTDALSPGDVKQYYDDNTMAAAAPLVWLCCGSFWHLIATTILYGYFHHDIPWVFVLVNILALAYLVREGLYISKWAPKGDKERAGEVVPFCPRGAEEAEEKAQEKAGPSWGLLDAPAQTPEPNSTYNSSPAH